MIYRINKLTGIKPGAFLLSTAKKVFACFLFFSASSYAQESVLTVMSGNSNIYQKFYSSLKMKLNKNLSLSQTSPDEVNSETLDKYNLVISVGKNAANAISKLKLKTTVIYSLIPDDTHLENNNACTKKNCYIVYINQPVYRYIKLFKVLFPRSETLVFINTSPDSVLSVKLRTAAGKLGIKYKEITINETSNLARTLIHKLKKNDVLLALPNPQIYNKNSAKNIILSTYHKNVPIIAYSESFAKAGALISLYSTIENIAGETANIVNKISTNGQQAKKEYYPDNFAIKINSAVSNSMNIDITEENKIMRSIK